MIKFILLAFVFAFAGCGKKEWSKESIMNNCLRDFKKRNEKEKLFDPVKIPYLCDCIADKMLVKYKSEAESGRDEAGATEIGRDCATEVLQK